MTIRWRSISAVREDDGQLCGLRQRHPRPGHPPGDRRAGVVTNAKGGVIWESGAFDNPQTAKEEWARPDAWVQLNPGGVQKVQQRQAITYPQGLDQLMQFAVSSIRDVTGVYLEILGLADRQQAGIVESQRKQAALTILASWFDSLRAYRREQGRLLYEFIERYIADGRLIKIDSENGPQYIPLIHQPGTLEFDVVIDSAPASVNVKQQTFETLQMFLPAAMKMGIPVPPSVLKYLPIPESLAAEWQQLLKSNGVPPQVQEMMTSPCRSRFRVHAFACGGGSPTVPPDCTRRFLLMCAQAADGDESRRYTPISTREGAYGQNGARHRQF